MLRTMKLALPLLALVAVVGCSKQKKDGKQSCDTNEYICDTAAFADRQKSQEVPPPDTTDGTWIELIRKPGCNGDPETWTYSARIRGPSNGEAIVDVWASEEAGGFNEAHPLAQSDAGQDWVDLSVQVRDDSQPQQYQPGQFSTYTCGETDIGPALTFTLRAYTASGGLGDCAIWTNRIDADDAISAVLNGSVPEPNQVRDRDEISPNNCRTWSSLGG